MDRLTTMEAFVRVVEVGSFSKAAKGWGCSKAAMSKYITALEEDLGIELLRRSTRSLSLTEAGKLYYQHCIDLLGEMEATRAKLREETAHPRGLLRVTAPLGMVSRYQDLMTTQFLARYPQITLDLHLTHRMVDLVEEGFDIAIRATSPPDSSLMMRYLAPAPLRLVASPRYLQIHGEPKHPLELQQHACLVDTNFRQQGRWPFKFQGKRLIVEVKGPIRINNPLMIRDLVLQGHGISLITNFIVEEDIKQGKLVSLMEESVDLQWSILAMYPKHRYVPGRVRAYLDHIAQGFQQSEKTKN